MDEIIYELRDHSSGLNCGRWDYIFSAIKRLREHPQFVLPDRSKVTMTAPFMDAYVRLLIQTCHKRGVHAMGGMAAQIPIKNDPAANDAAMAKVRADKTREVTAGHDGTWVAHPDLVKIAMLSSMKRCPNLTKSMFVVMMSVSTVMTCFLTSLVSPLKLVSVTTCKLVWAIWKPGSVVLAVSP